MQCRLSVPITSRWGVGTGWTGKTPNESEKSTYSALVCAAIWCVMPGRGVIVGCRRHRGCTGRSVGIRSLFIGHWSLVTDHQSVVSGQRSMAGALDSRPFCSWREKTSNKPLTVPDGQSVIYETILTPLRLKWVKSDAIRSALKVNYMSI